MFGGISSAVPPMDHKAADSHTSKLEAALDKYTLEVGKGNFKAAKKFWGEACSSAEALKSNEDLLSEAQKMILEGYEQLSESAGATVDRLQLLAEARDHVAKCQDPLSKLRSQLDKPEDQQDGPLMQRLWGLLLERATPLRSNSAYRQCPEVEQLLWEVEALEETICPQAEAAILHRDMQDALGQCTRVLRDLERARGRRQGQQVLALWTKLKIATECLLGPKAEQFNRYPQVKEFMRHYDVLAGSVEAEAKEMIHEEEARDILDKVQRPLAHAFVFLDKGDRAAAEARKREVAEAARPLLEDPFGYYCAFPQVEVFRVEYERLMGAEVRQRTAGDDAPKVWVRREQWDPDGSNCSICGKEFTFVRRRHHCRVCGCVACDKCCPRPALTNSNRICVRCG
eukprot:GGOE01041155.1.p1 GENE.GGOE01041155.1~~GGOE01041155.1.p1  ORF type:complete len:399 (+),score=89.51 GGOE01041155.1:54-1250(+)